MAARPFQDLLWLPERSHNELCHQFIKTDFFSLDEPFEIAIRADEHILVSIAISAESIIDFCHPPRSAADETTSWGQPVKVGDYRGYQSPLFHVNAQSHLEQRHLGL